jgi:hypothetical protein
MRKATKLVKVGDTIADPEGRKWRVIERHGRDILYSIKIEPIGWELPFKKWDWLLTADHWLTRGGWSVCTTIS